MDKSLDSVIRRALEGSRSHGKDYIGGAFF